MPRCASSSWCVPASRSSPLCSTRMRSMSWIVESRCAMAMRRAAAHHHLAARRESAARSRCRRSTSPRRGSRTRGSNASARANDSSCFCPTDSVAPRSATGVSRPPGRRSMNGAGVHRLDARARTASSSIVGVPEPDVAGDRAGEQVDVLQHQAEHARAARRGPLADVDAVDRDAPLLHVVEPQQQVDDRRLARAGGADDRHALARLDVERHVLQHRLARRRRRT